MLPEEGVVIWSRASSRKQVKETFLLPPIFSLLFFTSICLIPEMNLHKFENCNVYISRDNKASQSSLSFTHELILSFHLVSASLSLSVSAIHLCTQLLNNVACTHVYKFLFLSFFLPGLSTCFLLPLHFPCEHQILFVWTCLPVSPSDPGSYYSPENLNMKVWNTCYSTRLKVV